MTTRAASLVVHPRHVIFAEFSGRVPICLRLLRTLAPVVDGGYKPSNVASRASPYIIELALLSYDGVDLVLFKWLYLTHHLLLSPIRPYPLHRFRRPPIVVVHAEVGH
jgi:hypothetical protein